MSVESKTNSSREPFISKYLSGLSDILADSNQRLREVATLDPKSTDLQKINDLFGKGIWYADQYSQGLKKFNQSKRLEHLVNSKITFFGYAPTSFYSRLPGNFLGNEVCGFQLNPDKSVSDGLKVLGGNFALLECATVTQVAFHRALYNHLGAEKAEALFSGSSPHPLQLSGADSNPLSKLYDAVLIKDERDMNPGDSCYYSNIGNQIIDKKFVGYLAKHPTGTLRGQNVVCLKADKENSYLGFGLNSNGVTREEIEKLLWNGFNESPMDESYISPEIWSELYTKYLMKDKERSREAVRSLSQVTITWEEFQKLKSASALEGQPTQGKLDLLITRPDLQNIERLEKAPPKEVLKVFASLT